jgi:hypothetical protein
MDSFRAPGQVKVSGPPVLNKFVMSGIDFAERCGGKAAQVCPTREIPEIFGGCCRADTE